MEETRGPRVPAAKGHKLVVTGRKTGMITGVTNVISFDLKEILLETEQGTLTIEGDNLHISRLTLEKGEVDVEGQMDSFVYSDAKKHGAGGESLLARLFR